MFYINGKPTEPTGTLQETYQKRKVRRNWDYTMFLTEHASHEITTLKSGSACFNSVSMRLQGHKLHGIDKNAGISAFFRMLHEHHVIQSRRDYAPNGHVVSVNSMLVVVQGVPC